MSIKFIKQVSRLCGDYAKVYFSDDTKDYTVKYFNQNHIYHKEQNYYTYDKEDAIHRASI